ncbi:bifunctional Delta(1)-pyrroline-2-carboxylate/Delta(1)-piperideine-2-carboxylate reductase [Paraburkholderia lycopersici]|uniref:Ornithine cyclodeaminase/1-piperideine-2-carboxylate/1-pyrroline-2-carboxylate reductase [NAD(P)H] n=1 Tax=Paraburkholderia lycopersici TaxID=416944 RepID=A0A1G6RLY9_9BURK|nr:bifunctional Delta(1)-pyrroline-2-carboxylate/Delta(1)-piperideine-2-carboxylate reductase [Paraburkholderia lycopersici]SDD04936.1 ornithine cyclodeaminase/1-piperideine-2-carboxylate/1-pyrroline-2-carboxylate reductase [NAD(P)H] [Paraburkholderia lycopersici]
MEPIAIYDAPATARLLDFGVLIDALADAAQEHDAGRIHAPVRTGVPLRDNGVMLSMPASADDIAIHKLVSVCPANAARGMPTIFGAVTVCNGATGQPEFILDGPTVTGRRTAALSMLGVRVLHPGTPRAFLVIGTGQQARFHAEAIGHLHPQATLYVQGRTEAAESAFAAHLAQSGVHVTPARGAAPDEIDTVIAATTSKTPVYGAAARKDRLVIGVGAFTPDAAEIAPETVRASRVFVDDLAAAREEAGDLLQAGIDWAAVRTIGSAVADRQARRIVPEAPVLLKTVGSGAWDLAACRVARAAPRRV